MVESLLGGTTAALLGGRGGRRRFRCKVREGCAAEWLDGCLRCWVQEVDDDGCAARWERRCWVEEVDDEGCAASWTTAGCWYIIESKNYC